MEHSVVISLKGHDAGRAYLVAAELNGEFLLLVDGKYRTLANPKLKRAKHVKPAGKTELDLDAASDADIRKAVKAALEN